MKLWLSTMFNLLLIVSGASVCEGKSVTPADIVGYWRSDVSSAEYIQLREDRSYTTYNEDGDARFRGDYAVDGNYIVLGAQKKDDEGAFMVLEYVNTDSLRYKGVLSVSEYTRTSGLPSDKAAAPPNADGGERDAQVKGLWLKLPKFTDAIDGTLFKVEDDGSVVYNRLVNGGELNLLIERVRMEGEINEQAILETIARKEGVATDDITLADVAEIVEKYAYEHPCLGVSYQVGEDSARRENIEFLFPVDQWLFRVIFSISADAETDYTSDDKLWTWISSVHFVEQ